MEGLASFVSKSFDPSRIPQPHELPPVEDNSDDEGLDVGVETPPPSGPPPGIGLPRHPVFPLDNHMEQTDLLLSRQRAIELAERLNTSIADTTDQRLSPLEERADQRLSMHHPHPLVDQQQPPHASVVQGKVFINLFTFCVCVVICFVPFPL